MIFADFWKLSLISRNSDKIPRKYRRKITNFRRFQQHFAKILQKSPKFCKFSPLNHCAESFILVVLVVVIPRCSLGFWPFRCFRFSISFGVSEWVFPGFSHTKIPKVQRIANLVDLEKPCKMTIWLLSWLSIQPRTSPLKFDHFVVKSEKGSISNLSTKVTRRELRGSVRRSRFYRASIYDGRRENLHGCTRAVLLSLD